jgi:hypothetical protein
MSTTWSVRIDFVRCLTFNSGQVDDAFGQTPPYLSSTSLPEPPFLQAKKGFSIDFRLVFLDSKARRCAERLETRSRMGFFPTKILPCALKGAANLLIIL